MIRLTTTTQKLQIVLGSLVTTNQLPVMVSYSDKTSTTYDGGSQLTNSNDTTQTDICAAPAASTIRDVDYISIRNRDTVAATVTVIFDNNATDYELFKATLETGDQVVYTHGSGWEVLDSAGRKKTLLTTLTTGVAQVLPCTLENGTDDDIQLVSGTSASVLGPIDVLDFEPLLGEITIDGAAGWADITSDVVVKGSGAADPTWAVFRSGIYAYEFSATVMKEAWLFFHPNHDHDPGTDLYLHAHFSPNNTGTGVVRFGFEYMSGKGHGQGAESVFPTSTTVYAEFTIASSRKYEHLIAETAAITGTQIEVDSLMLVRVFRDAAHINDTFSGTVHIFTADIHHQVNRFATKNRSPNFYQ